MKNKILAALAATTLIFSACAVHNAAVSSANAPFYLAYDSAEVLRNQSEVATITSTGGLEIDGVTVNAKNFRSSHAGGVKGGVVVADILPGTHRVRLLRDPTGAGVRVNPVTYNFEAGKVYNVAIKLVVMVVEENPSVEVAQKIAENRRNGGFEGR